LDSLTSPSHTDSEHTDATADKKDVENTNEEANEEAPMSEETPAPASVSEQDQSTEQEEEEDKDSVTDCDSLATSSVNNRFTVLSEEQHSQDSLCDEMSNMDQEGEEGTKLAKEMERVTLDEAFIEDSDVMEQDMGSEDEVLEAKEYTVINQDPELAFHTLTTRTTPEKQECSVQSCLFQFTEVETLTENNSLLCVTCTNQQLKKDKGGGM